MTRSEHESNKMRVLLTELERVLEEYEIDGDSCERVAGLYFEATDPYELYEWDGERMAKVNGYCLEKVKGEGW